MFNYFTYILSIKQSLPVFEPASTESDATDSPHLTSASMVY